MRVVEYINNGNSFPIIVQNGKEKYFVKLRAGMSGKYSLLSEWFGNRLGYLVGLCTQEPCFIELDENLDLGNIHVEVKDLIKKSLGVNIAFHFQAHIHPVTEFSIVPVHQAKLIFLLDLLLLNMDRTRENPNLLQLSDRIVATDFESCLLFQELMNATSVLNNLSVLKSLRSNPLYHEISEGQYQMFFDQINAIEFGKLFEEVPSAVLSDQLRNEIIIKLNDRRKRNWIIPQLLKILPGIKIETYAERQRIIEQNRNRFRDSVERNKID